MSSNHQLLSPPPSDRDSPVSFPQRLFDKMPLDYAIETDVKPIIRDFKTGAIIDPGGAGDKYVVDRRGKRVPYEILPDGTPSPVPKGRRIKCEPAAYDRLQTADIKSEDDDTTSSSILTFGGHDTPQRRTGSPRRGAAQATALSRLKTSSPHHAERDLKPQARSDPCHDDSSDGSGSSSSEDDSSDDSDDDSSSSESSSSEEEDSVSIVDASSVFRPSRSPSRFQDTPSPAARSQSRIKQGEDEDLDVQTTPSPLTKTRPTSQNTSVPKPPSLLFYIPIRQTDCQSRTSSRLPAHPPSPVPAASTISPATSRVRGWRPINKQKRASKSSNSDAMSSLPTATVAKPTLASHFMPASQQFRAATAGPSTCPHGPAAGKSPSNHPSQKIKGGHVVQPSSQTQSSSALPSPKGKGKGIATTGDTARQDNRDRHSETGKTQDNVETKRSSNRDKNKWKKLRAKTKARKQKALDQANIAVNRHGPSRQVRIERSIEETPPRGLPTPDPSSAIGNTPGPSESSPTRSESGMFMTSPIQPVSSGLSPQGPPRAALAPMQASPPSRQGNKRSRSVYENADEAVIGAVANKILERFERKCEEWKDEARLGRERLDQKMELERAERQLYEQRWEEQADRDRRNDRTERERFALGLEKKMVDDRQKYGEEHKRLEGAVARHETRINTIQGQFQGQNERVDIRLDEHASRLSTIQGQLDGQKARSNSSGARLDATIRSVEELTKRLDEVERRDQNKQAKEGITDNRLQRLEAAGSPAVRSTQRPSDQTQGSGVTRPQVREVRPREAFDWSMRGRREGFISNTLIRSEHGKANPRTLPPRQPKTHGQGDPSSSKTAQPVGQSSSAPQTGRCNQGALDYNRSDTTKHHIPGAQHKPHPLPTPPSSDTTDPTEEPYIHPRPSPISRRSRLVVQPVVPKVQPQPGTPLPPPGPASSPSAAIESNPSPPRLPHLTHQEMKTLVFNKPLSGDNFSIDYDKDLDGGQTSAATAFLLNIPQRHISSRFRDFISRPAFVFELDDPVGRAKGCWAVRAERQQESQFKLYHDGRNYAFTLNRLAVRLWHDEDSVLRLLLSKDHKAVHVCHNKCCFNPEHIVVESRKEQMNRLSCRREGRCGGHTMWSKCGQMVERKRCIFV